MGKVITSIFGILVVGAIGAVILSTHQPTMAVQEQSRQQIQLQYTRKADEVAVQELVVKYVTAIQSYDYRTISRLDGLQYCTPDYSALVEKHSHQIISRIKRDKESHRVESVQINFIELVPPRTAYVTYTVRGKGTSLGEKPVSVEVRGDLVCIKIAGKWLVELDDLEPRKDVLVQISKR